MRHSILTIGIAAACIPALALAVPPREKGQGQRPGQQQRPQGMQRPGGNPAGPSLTPSRPGGGQLARPGAQPGRPGGLPSAKPGGPGIAGPGIGGGQPGGGIARPGGPGMGGGNRRGAGSIVANRPDQRPGQIGPRPGGSDRPGGGDRQGNWARPGNRPDVTFPGGNRPNVKRPDGNVNRPNFDVNRPIFNVNQPNVNVNRPTINRPNINVNRPVVVNRPVTNTNIENTVINQNTVINRNAINQNVVNRNGLNPYMVSRQVNYNNPYGYDRPWDRYYSDLHHHWQPTSQWNNYQPMYANYYANSSAYAGNWLGSGVSRYSYVNPFYTAQTVVNAAQPTTSVSTQAYDYSQPIRVPQAEARETDQDLVRSEQAIRRFDDARELFRRGEYGRANDAIDEAVKLLPSDPTMHQLRGLILFARQRYSEAAAAIYSVLAVSTGWDWETVSNLYEDPKRYEEQLRELEKAASASADASDVHFLLAYHATILGDMPTAQAELELVRAAKPNDQLTEALLASIQQRAQQG